VNTWREVGAHYKDTGQSEANTLAAPGPLFPDNVNGLGIPNLQNTKTNDQAQTQPEVNNFLPDFENEAQTIYCFNEFPLPRVHIDDPNTNFRDNNSPTGILGELHRVLDRPEGLDYCSGGYDNPSPPQLPRRPSQLHPFEHQLLFGYGIAEPQEPKKQTTCMKCYSEFPDDVLVDVSCSHKHCEAYFRALVKDSFSPSKLGTCVCWHCHAPVTSELISGTCPDLFSEFLLKRMEGQTLFRDRIYCFKCSLFIPQGALESTSIHCEACKADICTMCRGPHHDGKIPVDCPVDEGLLLVLALAKQQGWQTCPTCRSVSEHIGGCFYMS
jgi:hypothetical protein